MTDTTQRDTSRQLDELSEPQAAAITGLIDGRAVVDVAREAGVSRSTIYRWLEFEGFSAAMRAERRRRFRILEAHVPALASKALRALCKELDEPGTASATTIAAARAGLDAWRRLADVDLEDRLEALERAVAADGTGAGGPTS